jgi:hypothetical protein
MQMFTPEMDYQLEILIHKSSDGKSAIEKAQTVRALQHVPISALFTRSKVIFLLSSRRCVSPVALFAFQVIAIFNESLSKISPFIDMKPSSTSPLTVALRAHRAILSTLVKTVCPSFLRSLIPFFSSPISLPCLFRLPGRTLWPKLLTKTTTLVPFISINFLPLL